MPRVPSGVLGVGLIGRALSDLVEHGAGGDVHPVAQDGRLDDRPVAFLDRQEAGRGGVVEFHHRDEVGDSDSSGFGASAAACGHRDDDRDDQVARPHSVGRGFDQGTGYWSRDLGTFASSLQHAEPEAWNDDASDGSHWRDGRVGERSHQLRRPSRPLDHREGTRCRRIPAAGTARALADACGLAAASPTTGPGGADDACHHPAVALRPGAPEGRCLHCRSTVGLDELTVLWNQLERQGRRGRRVTH